ncbi:MAG TPA: Holliday junction resolvase RuvX [Chitinophagales bacterium]|nr:MAG: Holliday junction resolvase RuvX [Bacteroidia bacterium]HMV14359.1 Holliday junction resolvase RuvX [Chitinophagales bacterium]HMW13057.1 Holliday junction resolvase RuvX [Chitinophagales bacterium]HMX60659.1 Holliday junction resolvase RuvX [Chitinophagales bacterium]HMZ34367.1 Holliday junction resolvase RuvX [Chitinophagales bacterium]
MSKILAIDYGAKRTGFAISDESKIFAFGLSTQDTKNALHYIGQIIPKEKIDTIVIGIPKKLNNEHALLVPQIQSFIKKITQQFPDIQIVEIDERFTSKMAFQSMIDSGLKKKDRQNKALIDEISATIILQNYLEQQ